MAKDRSVHIKDLEDEIETQYDAYLEAKYEEDKEGAAWHLTMYHSAIKRLNAYRRNSKI